jgi:addiction module HigA family antidote
MPMKNPPHPGGFVLRQCIEPLGLTITDAAAALGVTRTTLSELVNGKHGISPEMAVRLSKVFGGSAEGALRPYPGAHRPHQTPAACIGLAGFKWNVSWTDSPRPTCLESHPNRLALSRSV